MQETTDAIIVFEAEIMLHNVPKGLNEYDLKEFARNRIADQLSLVETDMIEIQDYKYSG